MFVVLCPLSYGWFCTGGRICVHLYIFDEFTLFLISWRGMEKFMAQILWSMCNMKTGYMHISWMETLQEGLIC